MHLVDELNAILSDRYRVDREIGRGGMATVFLARDIKHDRQVALKLLNPELGAVLGSERFLAEIKLTANLNHPNLLPLFDSGEANGLLYYVMPFVEGESLRARLEREKQLPVDEAVRIAAAVASALDYAHRHGVVHRDLKPENILLQEGQPLVADFGIALAVSKAGGGRITQTGLSLGTPQYMSPEQATGDRVIDGRSDIYSLGAVTYEMLTGEAPHSANTSQAVIARLLTEQPRPIRSGRPSVPEHVDFAVQRALQKLPADRWSTAGEFGDALRGEIPIRGVTSVHAAPARTAAAIGTRFRDPVVLGALALAVAAISFAVLRPPREQPTPASAIRFGLALPPNLRLENAIYGSPLAISNDGSIIAFTGVDKQGVSALYLRTLDDPTPKPLPGTTGARQPFFSPDRQWVAFWSAGKLQKAPVAGGYPVPIADVPLIYGASWSPSGTIVLASGNVLYTVPSVGGSLRRLVKSVSPFPQFFPLALADGRHAVYAQWETSGVQSARLAVVDLETGEMHNLGVSGTYALAVVDGALEYGTAAAGVYAIPFDPKTGRTSGSPIPIVSDVAQGASGGMKGALSPSGTLVYQSGSADAQVVAVDMHGVAHPYLPVPGSYGYPRLSPDGKRLALTVRSGPRADIWIYDLASGTTSRLTSDGAVNERPEWTPDGKRVLYRSDRKNSALWWQPADLSGPASALLESPRESYFEGIITPDGRSLVYQMDTLAADIMMRSLTGDPTPRPVVATNFTEDEMRISPDGRFIAFHTDASGSEQVVVQPFPGPGPRIQVSQGGGSEPVWAPDSRHLFYRQGQWVHVVTITDSPTLAVTGRSPLFEGDYLPEVAPHANYDVTHDGKELIMLKPAGDPQVTVVHNWAAELKTRMGIAAKR